MQPRLLPLKVYIIVLRWAEPTGSEASWQEGTPSRCPPPRTRPHRLPCFPGEAVALKSKGILSCPQRVLNSRPVGVGDIKVFETGPWWFPSFSPCLHQAPSRSGKLEDSWTNVVGSPERSKTSCELGCGGGGTLQTDVVLFLFHTGQATSVQRRSKVIFRPNNPSQSTRHLGATHP